MTLPNIMILGVGNVLLTDEGFGIHLIKKLEEEYNFGENVSVVDGGVLGIHLLGTIVEADQLLVIDVIKNNGEPGTMYRIDHEEIPERVRAKNSLHQIDFLETLTLCQALDKVPRTTIFGVEPKDITTHSIQMTPPVDSKVDRMITVLLEELDRLGAAYCKKGDTDEHVSCNPFKNS